VLTSRNNKKTQAATPSRPGEDKGISTMRGVPKRANHSPDLRARGPRGRFYWRQPRAVPAASGLHGSQAWAGRWTGRLKSPTPDQLEAVELSHSPSVKERLIGNPSTPNSGERRLKW